MWCGPVNLRMVLSIQVAVLALVAGTAVLYVGIRDTADDVPESNRTLGTTMQPAPTRVVSERGGFAIILPPGISADKKGNTATLSTADNALVVTAGPVAGGSLDSSADVFLRSVKRSYTEVRVLGTERQDVDGRRAVATFGQAVNDNKVRISFVNIVVKARPRNFVINSFARYDTSPATVRPKVDAILDGFTVLEPD